MGFNPFKKLTPREKAIQYFLKNEFGYSTRAYKLYDKAFTHKSLAKEQNIDNNERLEFLGDSILDSVVASYLYRKYPNLTEGELTALKSKVVNRKNMGEMAIKMGLDHFVLFVHSKNLNIQGICGNALEALIAAIYLDKGYIKTRRCIVGMIKKYIDLEDLRTTTTDHKSSLINWAQQNKKELTFKTNLYQESKGQSNKYVSEVLLNEKLISIAYGRSKKVAEQSASEKALEKLPT
jgi:ribonuclease-3